MGILKKKIAVKRESFISFDVKNIYDEDKDFVLFGNNSKDRENEFIKTDFSTVFTYEELCLLKMVKPFKIEKFYIESANYNQVETQIDLVQTNIRSQELVQNIFPRKHPQQYQNGVVEVNNQFTVDFFTKFRYTILPKTTVTFTFALSNEQYVYVSRFTLLGAWLKSKFKKQNSNQIK